MVHLVQQISPEVIQLQDILLTMSESHDAIHDIENDRVVYHAIIVQFSKVFYLCNSSLIELEIVLLQAKDNIFKNIINYRGDKILVITIQCAGQDGEEMDVAKFDFSWF